LTVYAAIWRATLCAAGFSILLTGVTGTGKSTLAALAQSFYGPELDRQRLPASWASTANFLTSLAFLVKDALLTIDDWVPPETQRDLERANRDADRVLRGQGNNSGRGRCKPDGTPKEPKAPRGLILSTGEAVPAGASLNARFLNLEVRTGDLLSKQSFPRYDRAERLARAGRFAQTTAGFVQWLAAYYETKLAEAREQVLALAAVFRGYAQHLHPRTAMIAAELLAGLETFPRTLGRCL
jgi:hypothetical protein